MIFVTGAPRSGTSLTMAVLNACGANLGAPLVKGLREHREIRENLVKPYLRQIGAGPLGQTHLPGLNQIQADPHWRAKVEAHSPGEPWAVKIIKGALFWPLWVEHFPEARWVIVMREPDDIARSCLRTPFMKAYNTERQWADFARFYHQRCAELQEAVGDQAIVVWPHDAVRGDPEAYRPMIEHCGLVWSREAVQAEINPRQWRAA